MFHINKKRGNYSPLHSKTSPCFVGFPSEVRHIEIVENGVAHGSITLSWKPPYEDGGMPNSLRYDVTCGNQCALQFSPGKNNLNKTKVEISGLIAGRNYNFIVYSKNEISEKFAGKEEIFFANKTFKIGKNAACKTSLFISWIEIILFCAGFIDERHNPSDELILKTEYKIMGAFVALLILVLIITIVCILRYR